MVDSDWLRQAFVFSRHIVKYKLLPLRMSLLKTIRGDFEILMKNRFIMIFHENFKLDTDGRE